MAEKKQDIATGPKAAFPPNLPGLTAIRFWLALGVVLFHYQLQWEWDTSSVTPLLERTWLAVDVFFILSGFVLTHAYRSSLDNGRLNYLRFLVARVARIYPTHIVALLFVLAMVMGASVVGAQFDAKLYEPAAFLPTLLLVHAWLPTETTAQWNGPSWSLSAEWFAYLSFPLFAWVGVVLRRRPWVLIGLSVLLFVGLDLLYQALFDRILVHAQVRMGILRIIPEFLLGIALYRLGERANVSRGVATASAVGSTLLILGLLHFGADDRLVVAGAGLLVLALAMLSKAGADAGLAKPWMLAAGEASYALYLIHLPILIAWKGLISVLTNRPSSYFFAGWEVMVLLLLTLSAAFVMHYVIEAPARRWIRRLADARWPERSPVAMKPGSQPPDV